MRSRLSTVAADIDQALARVSETVALQSAEEAAHFALEVVGVRDTSSKSSTELEAMASAYDSEYFATQQSSESGRTVDQLTPFAKARALSALAFAKRGQPAEAIYEAIIATDDAPKLRELLLGMVNGPA
jgi:hypothetical protein